MKSGLIVIQLFFELVLKFARLKNWEKPPWLSPVFSMGIYDIPFVISLTDVARIYIVRLIQ